MKLTMRFVQVMDEGVLVVMSLIEVKMGSRMCLVACVWLRCVGLVFMSVEVG